MRCRGILKQAVESGHTASVREHITVGRSCCHLHHVEMNIQKESTMFNKDEQADQQAMVQVASFQNALPAFTGKQQDNGDERAEMFDRYLAAQQAGIFDRLITWTKRHGTLSNDRIKWAVERDEMVIEVMYFKTGKLEARRNDVVVLDDKQGRSLVFKPGAQGAWLLALEAEHDDLERDAAINAVQAQRQRENEAEARRNEFP